VYLVYSPSWGPFTVDLSGTDQEFESEWFNTKTGEIKNGGKIKGGGTRIFWPLLNGGSVMYLHGKIDKNFISPPLPLN
jgi:hypothetical protein